MTFSSHQFLFMALLLHSINGFGAPKSVSSTNSLSDPSLSTSTSFSEADMNIEPTPSFAVSQLLPAYKIGLKKGMFELQSGLGHSDASKETTNGQSANIKTTPQTDFIPFQVAYGLTNNTSISISGKVIRKQEKVTNSNYEGYSEPQFSLSHAFRNDNTAVLISGSYSPSLGPQTNSSIGATRTEGNTLAGGASGELLGGYFMRLDPIILGGEAAYLYKDSRIVNRDTIAIFTGQSTGTTQTRIEGGHEKTLRGIVELAAPFRAGFTFGRIWVEQEEEIPLYQLTHTINNSYYRNFMSAYARIQINPKLSLLPTLSYTESPDTSGITSSTDQEVSTQVSLRYRF